MVTDKKLQHTTDGTTIDYYLADVRTASYYSAYGAISKSFNDGQIDLAHNGQKRSTEISATAQTAEFWECNGDIGKRWNADPVPKVHESPYAIFGNNSIWLIDRNGADTTPVFRENTSTLFTQLKSNNISSWLDLLNFRPSPDLVKNMQNSRGLRAAFVQWIGAAGKDLTNLDAYTLQINKLPEGVKDAKELLELIRANFNSFMPSDVKFAGFNSEQRKTWDSRNPYGAVMSFDKTLALGGLVGDDASVLLSKYYADANGVYWNFTTVNTPWGDWGHPVSGTRQFGVSVNTSAGGATGYTVFIRGIDRVTDFVTWLGGGRSSDGVFEKAHKTWLTVMDKIQAFVNERGGSAESSKFVYHRLCWKEYIKKSYTGPSENAEPNQSHVVK